MQLSHIQMLHSFFLNLKVETNPAHSPGAEVSRITSFDFNDVNINERVRFVRMDKETDFPGAYSIMLGLSLTGQEGKQPPYLLEVDIVGIFECDGGERPQSEIESLVRVNGLSMLYGAIREQINTLTARFLRGSMVMPTVTFLDHKEAKGPLAES